MVQILKAVVFRLRFLITVDSRGNWLSITQPGQDGGRETEITLRLSPLHSMYCLEPPFGEAHRGQYIDALADVFIDRGQYGGRDFTYTGMMVLMASLDKGHVLGVEVHRIGQRQGFVVECVDVSPETPTGVPNPSAQRKPSGCAQDSDGPGYGCGGSDIGLAGNLAVTGKRRAGPRGPAVLADHHPGDLVDRLQYRILYQQGWEGLMPVSQEKYGIRRFLGRGTLQSGNRLTDQRIKGICLRSDITVFLTHGQGSLADSPLSEDFRFLCCRDAFR